MTTANGASTPENLTLNALRDEDCKSSSQIYWENSRGGEYKELKVYPEEYSYSEKNQNVRHEYCINPDTFYGEDFGEYELPKSCSREEMEPRMASNLTEPEIREQSIFVYSSPAQFPDIYNASKSVFGSIFVRTGRHSSRDSSFLKKIMEHQDDKFSKFECASDLETSASEGRTDVNGSDFRAFEKGDVAKDVASDGSSQWEVHPITESALFTVRTRDRVHQTRRPSDIEERVANGTTQHLQFAYDWPSGSVWTGHWDGLGMAGEGTLVMPHEVTYVGKMENGMCHDDDARLIYPNGLKAIDCTYKRGELLDCHIQFPDLLNHEKQNWDYCQYPDRRFWNEIQNGLRAAKVTQKTQQDPPRKIPLNSYDTNDGFYNPKTKMLVNQKGELLRVPTCEEAEWVKQKCRKGFHQYTGFCPELFENWFCDDPEMVKSMTEMQKKYFKGEITNKELHQFYADNDLLPNCFTFHNMKPVSSFEMEKGADVCPSPKKLIHRLEKRYEGHRIPLEERTERKADNCKKLEKQKWYLHKDDTAMGKPSAEKLPVKVKFERSHTEVLNVVNSSADENNSRTNLTKIVSESPTKPGAETIQKKLHTARSCKPQQDSSEASKIFKYDPSTYKKKLPAEIMTDIIMEIVQNIVLQEREKHRNRFVLAQSIGNVEFGPRDEKERCVRVLEELYNSIPRTEEYCDSMPYNDCDLRSLAKDKFQMLKYWGKRIFTLGFDEEFYDE